MKPSASQLVAVLVLGAGLVVALRTVDPLRMDERPPRQAAVVEGHAKPEPGRSASARDTRDGGKPSTSGWSPRLGALRATLMAVDERGRFGTIMSPDIGRMQPGMRLVVVREGREVCRAQVAATSADHAVVRSDAIRPHSTMDIGDTLWEETPGHTGQRPAASEIWTPDERIAALRLELALSQAELRAIRSNPMTLGDRCSWTFTSVATVRSTDRSGRVGLASLGALTDVWTNRRLVAWRGRRRLLTVVVERVFDDLALVRNLDGPVVPLEPGDELRPVPQSRAPRWE